MAAILVVDDDLVIRTIFAQALRRNGHTLYTACSGAQALGILARKPVDVLITDLWMSDMTGLDLARSLGEAAVRPRIILVTGDPHALTEGDGSSLVDSVMTKPINLNELKAQVAQACGAATSESFTSL